MEKVVCNDPGEPPKQVMLRPGQLVVNEEYQRQLSKNSLDAIRRMAHEFDWDSYKALNVAPTDDPEIFEVVDGQHTAIAAKTNGRVPFLPCLLHDSTTLKEKAQGFLGINTRRIALTPMAIFNARVAAQEDDAIIAQVAMDRAGVELVALPPNNRHHWNIGQTMAIGTILTVAKKKGDARLSAILRIAVNAKAAPISSLLIKALDACVPVDSTQAERDMIVKALIRQGIGLLELKSAHDTSPGGRSFETMATMIATAAGLTRHSKRKPGRSKP